MASLIDKMRSTQEAWSDVQVHGFDPDLRTCGHSVINAHYRTDVLGVFVIDSVFVGCIHAANKKLISITQTDSMVEAIYKYPLYKTSKSVSFIESQQVYPDKDMDRGEMVAKANDLLRLAHIAGAYHLLAAKEGHTVYVKLPHEWKGNRPKPAMHLDVVHNIMAACPPNTNPFLLRKQDKDGMWTHTAFDLTEKWRTDDKNFHTMDALCMAHKGLINLARGELLVKKGNYNG